MQGVAGAAAGWLRSDAETQSRVIAQLSPSCLPTSAVAPAADLRNTVGRPPRPSFTSTALPLPASACAVR